MLKIDVKFDAKQLIDDMKALAEGVKDKATVRALNEVADQAKVRASREIRAAGYNLKAATIKKAITITRAKPGALVAIVRASGKPIPLYQYDAREGRGGAVTVKVKGARKVVKDAFTATMPTGHKGVFVRVGNGHKKVERNGRKRWYGLPIKELFGPSIPAAFGNQVVQDALEALVREKLPRILKHELDRLIR